MTIELPLTLSRNAGSVDHASCGSCSERGSGHLQRLGLGTRSPDAVMALVGAPNTGKSTVFNQLTGLRQRVGNWSGTTVTRTEGAFGRDGRVYQVVDLPGTYSLMTNSRDEDIARDFLLFSAPDVVVVVVDATRLERNLSLVLQVLQISGRVVIALNLMDEAQRHGLQLDVRHLARTLGVPVVPMTARRGEGIPQLVDEAIRVAALDEQAVRPRPLRLPSADVARAVDGIAALLESELPGLPSRRWVALRLLEGDPHLEAALRDGTVRERVAAHGQRLASAGGAR